MLLRKACRFRIYPDAAWEELFRRTIGCCRLAYNFVFGPEDPRVGAEPTTEAHAVRSDQRTDKSQGAARLPLRSSASSVGAGGDRPAQGVCEPLRGTCRLSDIPKEGQNDSFRYPDPKQIKIEEDRIFPPKAGWTRLVMHRPIKGKVKNVTVSAVAGDWHVSAQVEKETDVPVNRGPAVGIDLGSAQPIVLSDGTVIDLPRATPAASGSQPRGGGSAAGGRARAIARRQNAKRPGCGLEPPAAQGNHDHRQEPRRGRHRGPQSPSHDQDRQGYDREPRNARPETATENRALLDVSPRTIRTMLEYKAPGPLSSVRRRPRSAAAPAKPSTRPAASADLASSAPTADRSSTRT
jgi:putative transposase